MPVVDQEYDALAVALVHHLVVEAVVEQQTLALAPRALLRAHTQRALGGNVKAKVRAYRSEGTLKHSAVSADARVQCACAYRRRRTQADVGGAAVWRDVRAGREDGEVDKAQRAVPNDRYVLFEQCGGARAATAVLLLSRAT